MRCVLLIAGVAVLAGCPPQTVEKLPPEGQFYFPTGIVHTDAPGNPDGILYVASADTDRRFDFGAITAVDLSKVGLPPFGAPVGFNDAGVSGPLQLTDLKLAPGSRVMVAPFIGEMAALPMADAGVRLFFPSRSEGHRLYAVDAPLPASPSTPPLLSCFTPAGGLDSTVAGDGGLADCSPTGLTLVGLEKTETGIPRAPAPIGVAISPSREVWVTSLQQADTPKGSTLDARAYVVHVNGDNPRLIEADMPQLDGGGIRSSFVNVGPGATHSIVVGARYAYATGRIYASSVPANLVRAIDTTTFTTFNTSLENTFTVFEARGAALSSKEDRLYLLGRSPDSLLVASVTNPTGGTPNVRVERSVPLPQDPNLITTIPRPGKSDLVMITCSTAGVVVFYDDEVGNLTGQIAGVGLQPYAIAVDTRPAGGARTYVTNFTDGRVAVIDVPDLSRPSSAKIVAFLGASQLCLTRGANETTSCDGGVR